MGLQREDIEFSTTDGTTLRGWFYRPEDSHASWPVVVMSHGFGAVKEMYLDVFAAGFAEAGLACLVYDHRFFGSSDGDPRQEIDPHLQVADLRDAVTFAQQLDGVDPQRLGLWGSSYSGGHVLVVAATDSRVRCVVSQVPTISGARNTLRRFPGNSLFDIQDRFAADRSRRMRGQPAEMVPIVPGLDAAGIGAAGEEESSRRVGNDMGAWLTGTPAGRLTSWRNEMTLRSQELYAAYEPGSHVERIGPTPLLMISMTADSITPTDEILAAYERAHEPKRLVLFSGGHFDVYGAHREAALAAARDWFGQHLRDT